MFLGPSLRGSGSSNNKSGDARAGGDASEWNSNAGRT